MKILLNKELKPYNSFAVEQNADLILQADSVQDLIDIWSDNKYSDMIKLPLGSGSNTLFCNNFNGVIVLNRIYGKSIVETKSEYLITVSSGEDWPTFVEWCVDNEFYGIENLAMIPGCAGTAPIQNIGAYGLELKDVCESVEYLDLETLQLKRLKNGQCKFGYRESIFKHDLKDKCIITAITLRFSKKWTPLLTYGPLENLRSPDIKIRDVFNLICDIRRQKLPNPSEFGNAGSFFKNPIISNEKYQTLLEIYPDLPAYDAEDGKKIPAGWLIDRAGLKGVAVNDAQVHQDQALVLINKGRATSDDILQLAYHVKLTVFKMYQIELEHEVRFYSNGKESFLSELFCERSY